MKYVIIDCHIYSNNWEWLWTWSQCYIISHHLYYTPGPDQYISWEWRSLYKSSSSERYLVRYWTLAITLVTTSLFRIICHGIEYVRIEYTSCTYTWFRHSALYSQSKRSKYQPLKTLATQLAYAQKSKSILASPPILQQRNVYISTNMAIERCFDISTNTAN